MATQGPNPTGTATSVSAGTSANVWVNVNNIKLDDGSFASETPNGSADPGEYLEATNFGFSIPSTATINGITVAIKRRDPTNQTQDTIVKLIKGGVISGTNKQSVTVWPTTFTNASYGSGSDLWGLTLLPSDINASTFGIALQVSQGSGDTPQVDFVTITVTYTDISVGGFNIAFV